MATPERAHLDRVLGPVSATCIVIGAIVGVGIFFTPSRVVGVTNSGNLALVAWGIGGLLALLGALTFAEIGGMYVRSGGQYAALRDSYGPLGGFMYVFCNATAIQCGATAIIAIVCARHAMVGMTGGEPTAQGTMLIASVLIALLTVGNVVGVKLGAGVQNFTVFAKVLTLLAIAALSLMVEPAGRGSVLPFSAGPETATLAFPGGPVALVFAALVPVMFSYGGWQHALWIGGEISEPRRTVPRAIAFGTLIVVGVYLVANWAYLRLLGEQGVMVSGALAADAVSRAFPEFGVRLVAGAVALSAFGVLNAQLLSGPRLVYGMAQDGRFFTPFAGVHPKFHTPYAAIAMIGGLGLVLLWAARESGVDALLNGVVLVDAVFMALTGLAVVVLRRRKADEERSVRVPLYPLVPVLFVLGMLAVIVGAFLDEKTRNGAWIGLVWIAAAVLCYLAFFRKGSLANDESGRSGEI